MIVKMIPIAVCIWLVATTIACADRGITRDTTRGITVSSPIDGKPASITRPDTILYPVETNYVWCYNMAYGVESVPFRGNIATDIYVQMREICSEARGWTQPKLNDPRWYRATTMLPEYAYELTQLAGGDGDDYTMAITYTGEDTGGVRNVWVSYVWIERALDRVSTLTMRIDESVSPTDSPWYDWLLYHGSYVEYISLNHLDQRRYYRRLPDNSWQYFLPFEIAVPMIAR